MKEAILSILKCPACKGPLAADAWTSDGEEILVGLLGCECGESFPVIGGVPRMLLGPLRRQLHADYPGFFESNRNRLPAALLAPRGSANRALRDTQRSFGYEWTAFAEMRPEWEKNFWGYMAPLTARSLAGKAVLDAGCGMGRHLYHAAQHAETAIGVDFSRAVDSAYQNTRHLPAAHVVQANLLELPFGPESFDFVYCLGVLHHLPDPTAGLRAVADVAVAGGDIRVYVYWDLSDAPLWKRGLLRAVNLTRRVTTRLPHPALRTLCYPIAAGAWITFIFPHKWLAQYGATRSLAEALPLGEYAQYSFRTLVNDQFDRFSAPLERRYGAAEVADWLQEVGLSDVVVRPHWGWVGHARKPGVGGDSTSPHRTAEPAIESR